MDEPHVLKYVDIRSRQDAQPLIDAAGEGRYSDKPIILDFSRARKIFPGGAVPLAAAIDFFRDLGLSIETSGLDGNAARTHVDTPMTIDRFVKYETPLTNVVWKYRDEKEAQRLSSLFMEALTHKVPCEAGVIDTLNWCIYEVLDNVFQHSRATCGFVMMQLHANERRCVVAVTDTGRGVHRAMAEGVRTGTIDINRVRTAPEAIEYALAQGVTSKGKANQGNGLHGLRRAVEINGGRLMIDSGRGSWSYMNGQSSCQPVSRHLLGPENHATSIDWQLDCSTPVSINEALGQPDDWSSLLESIEAEYGQYRIDAVELEEYLGSRAMGHEIRCRILNYLNAGAQQVAVDLSNVGIISSSFADEVMGKLAVELGELEYRKRIYIEGASATNRGLLERAIALRLETGI